jgi:hypothetical protein
MSPFRERRHLEQLMPVTCKQKWEDMVPLRGSEWRMCARCSTPVVRVHDEEGLQRAAKSGSCVYVPYGIPLTGGAPPLEALLRQAPPPPPPGMLARLTTRDVLVVVLLVLVAIYALLLRV